MRKEFSLKHREKGQLYMVTVIPYLKASMVFHISVISADSIKLSPVRKRETENFIVASLDLYI